MAGRADKYCYECATVLPRTAVTCFACRAAQPPLPARPGGALSRPPGAERPCPACGAPILVRAELCVHCGARQSALAGVLVGPNGTIAQVAQVAQVAQAAAAAPGVPAAGAPIAGPAAPETTAEPQPGAAAPGAPSTELGDDSWDVTHAMLALGAVLVVLMGVTAWRGDAPGAQASVASAAPTASASAPVAPAASTPPGGVTETDAWAAARQLVTTHLRAPPNVEFPSEHHTRRIGPDTFEVISYFEMANTAGVMVRTHWTVVVARVGGEWQVVRLEARN